MSYLVRSGNNRNDIYFLNSNSTEGRYLHRTSWTGLNSMQWLTINASNNQTDAVLLQRNGTGRNDIVWGNHSITFLTFSKYKLGSMYSKIGFLYYNLKVEEDRGATSRSTYTYLCLITSVGKNSFNTSVQRKTGEDLSYMGVKIYFATAEDRDGFVQEAKSNYTKISINPYQHTQNMSFRIQSTGIERSDTTSGYDNGAINYYVRFNCGEHTMGNNNPSQVIFS